MELKNKEKKLEAFGRLLQVMEDLRAGCPWDQKQTWESLRHLTIEEVYELGDASSKIKVSVLDFGVKQHILQCLVDRGAHVRVHPAKTDFATLKAFNPPQSIQYLMVYMIDICSLSNQFIH